MSSTLWSVYWKDLISILSRSKVLWVVSSWFPDEGVWEISDGVMIVCGMDHTLQSGSWCSLVPVQLLDVPDDNFCLFWHSVHLDQYFTIACPCALNFPLFFQNACFSCNVRVSFCEVLINEYIRSFKLPSLLQQCWLVFSVYKSHDNGRCISVTFQGQRVASLYVV